MPQKERKRAAEIVRECSDIPVIIHAGTNTVEDTKDLGVHAKEIGADAIAVITPMFYPYTSDGLSSYFSKVSNACMLPLFIYSNPGRGTRMSPEAIAKTASENSEWVVGVKESSGDIGFLGKVIQAVPNLKVFSGADNCYLPGLVIGTAGQVSGYATLIPELYVSLHDAWKKKDIELAMKSRQRSPRSKGSWKFRTSSRSKKV